MGGTRRQEHRTKVRSTTYAGYRLRFLGLPGSGVLLNTKDVCAIAGIRKRTAGSTLTQPCLDLDDVMLVISNVNIDFVQWLLVKFAEYEVSTDTRPVCDDDWSTFE